MTAGTLYTGLGGFDLGLAWAGVELRWQAERDPALRALLAGRWPSATQFVSAEQAAASAGAVDLVYGEPSGELGWPATEPIVRAGLRSARWVLVEGRPDAWAPMREAARPLLAAGWRVAYRVLRYATSSAAGRSRVRQRVWMLAARVGDPVAVCDRVGLRRETPLSRLAGVSGPPTAETDGASVAALESLRGLPRGWADGLDEAAARRALAEAQSPWVGERLGHALERACARAA